MTKTRVMMLVAVVVVFCAGVAVGLLASPSPRERRGGSWLTNELDLTPQQRAKMRQIWAEPDPAASMRQQSERRRAIEQARDQALRALLSEDQKVQHDRILQEHEQQLAQLGEERRKWFQERMELTKAILTEAQRRRYDELMERGRGRRPMPGGAAPPWPGREPGGGPPMRGPGADREQGPERPSGRDESLQQ